jgi:hypothetical protein
MHPKHSQVLEDYLVEFYDLYSDLYQKKISKMNFQNKQNQMVKFQVFNEVKKKLSYKKLSKVINPYIKEIDHVKILIEILMGNNLFDTSEI